MKRRSLQWILPHVHTSCVVVRMAWLPCRSFKFRIIHWGMKHFPSVAVNSITPQYWCFFVGPTTGCLAPPVILLDLNVAVLLAVLFSGLRLDDGMPPTSRFCNWGPFWAVTGFRLRTFSTSNTRGKGSPSRLISLNALWSKLQGHYYGALSWDCLCMGTLS